MRTVEFDYLNESVRTDIALAEYTAINKCYPRNKNTRVGCVIESDTRRWLGANAKPGASWLGTTCAERMALDQFRFDGIGKRIGHIVVYATCINNPFQQALAPCGNCRELTSDVLGDLGQDDVDIYMAVEGKQLVTIAPLTELLPMSESLTKHPRY